MQAQWRDIIWGQFGAAIDSLERAIVACPEEVWSDRSRQPEYWYLVFHTLFWLDYYLADDPEGYVPPPGEILSADWQIVTPGYFETVGVRLLEGRTWDELPKSRDNGARRAGQPQRTSISILQ